MKYPESKQWLSCTPEYKKMSAYLDELVDKLSSKQDASKKEESGHNTTKTNTKSNSKRSL